MEYFKKLLFIATSDEEAQPLIDVFKMVPLEDDIDLGLPAKWYVAIQTKVKLYLLVSGENKQYGLTRCGTLNSSILAWEGIRTTDPDYVISCGFATGLSHYAKVGDLYLCNYAQYYDRQFDCDESEVDEGALKYALGNYSTLVPSALNFEYKLGVIASGNNCHVSEDVMEALEANRVSLIDMSTAAIAEICDIRHKPLIVIKGVHQLVTENNQESVLSNEGVIELEERIKFALEEIVSWAMAKLISPVKKKTEDATYFKTFSFRRFKKHPK